MDPRTATDQNAPQKLSYPKAVFFLFGYGFCGNFYFYGYQTILVIYLNTKLDFSETAAKTLFHAIPMLSFFLPIFGAIIADTLLGKFNTVVICVAFYFAGAVLLELTTFQDLQLPHISLMITSLVIMAVASGFSKACAMPFTGDQFVLPEQQKQLVFTFAMLYLMANVASLSATFLTPLLRSEVDCLGETGCYPLAFGVPTIVQAVGITTYILGRPFYKIVKPDKSKGNLLVNVVKCIWYGISHRKDQPPVNNWLDRSKATYGDQLVDDIRALKRVFVVYLPLPVYYALYYQPSSAWVLQGAKMEGDIGFYRILPEQMQLINPLLVVVLIPIFSHAVYPVLNKCHILTTPLQKMCTGGFIIAGTFIISGFVSLALEESDPVLPGAGETHLRIYDPTDCQYKVDIPGKSISNRPIKSGYFEALNLPLNEHSEKFQVTFSSEKQANCPNRSMEISVIEKEAFYMYINYDGVRFLSDELGKSQSGKGLVRTIFARKNDTATYELVHVKKQSEFQVVGTGFLPELKAISPPGEWRIRIKPNFTSSILHFRLSATYVALIDSTRKSVHIFTMFAPSPVHILWQVPQFILLTIGEVLFAIAALEFVYTEAPVTMKSIVQALFMLTTSIGNLLVLIIEQCNVLTKQSYTFFLYSGLMGLDMVCFTILAIKYKYANPPRRSIEMANEAAVENTRRSI